MIKIVNLKTKPTPEYDIYIGRANKWLNLPQSKWANPFVMKNEADRDRVIKEYKEYLISNEQLMADLPELEDKILACWCHNDELGHKMCHGDVLRGLFRKLF